jgi:predicted SPOUT superfamily RNA methylase MTH1
LVTRKSGKTETTGLELGSQPKFRNGNGSVDNDAPSDRDPLQVAIFEDLGVYIGYKIQKLRHFMNFSKAVDVGLLLWVCHLW